MKHLDFVDELNKLGISVRGTNIEGGIKTYRVPYGMSEREVLVTGLDVQYTDNHDNYTDPKKSLISVAIDMGSWKHSWHNEIKHENYDKFQEIIQQKILDRAKEIEQLLTTYFIIGNELSKH